MVEAKYFVKIIEAKKSLKVSKEVSEIVKNAVGSKMVQRMKKEYVDCPVAKKQIPFIECFLCISFIRRVKGEVHCRGEEFRIRT
ncbi:MAG: hypothetical protein ABDH32_04420 [Candidatus Caldarchaeales archaeon]